MTGENIICFAKDWSEEPTSNNHVMIELARRNNVLWINSLATRAPKLSSGRDVGKIKQKLREFRKGPQRVPEGLWVFTPLVLPLPHSKWAKAVNSWILRRTMKSLRRKLGFKNFQLWTFLPNSGEYIGQFGEDVDIYYCVDEWAGFSYVDGPKTTAAEKILLRKVDAVFAVTQELVEKKIQVNPETHLSPHGVDYPKFARAMTDEITVPEDIAHLVKSEKPVIGFYGTLQDWVDYDLVEFLATRHPEWEIVMVGKELVDVSRMKAIPNVHIMGRRDHRELPRYCKGFDVGIIPYIIDDRMLTVNPIKLREYLSAGLPTVSTAVPEVIRTGLCTIAYTFEEFEQGVIDALKNDTPDKRMARSESMRNSTWEARVAAVCEHVMRIKAAKCQKRKGAVPGLSARAT